MNGKLAYVCDSLYMFVDSSVKSIDESTKCKVYDVGSNKWTPELCIGSWTCRVGPWNVPTQDQVKKINLLLKVMGNEYKSGK